MACDINLVRLSFINGTTANGQIRTVSDLNLIKSEM